MIKNKYHTAIAVISLALAAIASRLPVAHAGSDCTPRIVAVVATEGPLIEARLVCESALGDQVPLPTPVHVTIDGQLVNHTETMTLQPGALAIVVDTSRRMSDQGTIYRTRSADMLPLVQQLLSGAAGVSGQQVSLLAFGDTVEALFPLTSDVGAVVNAVTLADGPLLPAPLDDDGSSYRLGEALTAALAQLDEAPPEAPRTLALFASGDPSGRVELVELAAELEAAREAGRPVRVLVFGFGAETPGSFERYPADQGRLQQLASALQGSYFAIGATNNPLDAATIAAISAAMEGVVAPSNQTLLRFDATDAAGTQVQVQIVVDDKMVASTFVFGPAPRARVQAETTDRGLIKLSITPIFQQSPIVAVSYMLNGRPITPPVGEGPTFALAIDTADPDFYQRFAPGLYYLTALVHDAAGHESTTVPVPLVVPAAAAKPVWVDPADLAGPLPSALLGALVGGLVIYLFRQRWPRGRQAGHEDDEFTRPVRGLGTAVLDEEDTARVLGGDDEDTLPFLPLTEAVPRWALVVVEGAPMQRFELDATCRNYELGRPTIAHTPAISLNHPMVSRSLHARLTLFADGVELTALPSTGGTYIGEERRPLLPETTAMLGPGDVFWVSQAVKLRLERTDENAA